MFICREVENTFHRCRCSRTRNSTRGRTGCGSSTVFGDILDTALVHPTLVAPMTWFTTDTARIGILGLVLALLLPLGFPFVALAVVGLAVVALAFAIV